MPRFDLHFRVARAGLYELSICMVVSLCLNGDPAGGRKPSNMVRALVKRYGAELSGPPAEGFRMVPAYVPKGLTPVETVRFEQSVATNQTHKFLLEHPLHAGTAILDTQGDSVAGLIENKAFPESGHPAEAAARVRGFQAEAWIAVQEEFLDLGTKGRSNAAK